MKVDLFDYALPEGRIALRPAEPREDARLMVVGKTIGDRVVGDLADVLQPNDLVVFNDTRVIPAQLAGSAGGRKVSVTLHKRIDDARWQAFATPGRPLKQGVEIGFGRFSAMVEDKRALEDGGVTLKFSLSGPALMTAIVGHGVMPLPPYIQRQRHPDRRDDSDYQTIFARSDGAVAAPTAGLHFTPEILRRLDARGIRRVGVTLHVGAGTFLPVKAADTDDHTMHAEWGAVPAETAAAIGATKAAGGRVVAIGTTVLRILETAARDTGSVVPFAGDTRIFIVPGFAFKATDVLFTNFHLPRSTLLMLVAAFAGMDRMTEAYAHAIDAGYRFYSYGDASLWFRRTQDAGPDTTRR